MLPTLLSMFLELANIWNWIIIMQIILFFITHFFFMFLNLGSLSIPILCKYKILKSRPYCHLSRYEGTNCQECLHKKLFFVLKIDSFVKDKFDFKMVRNTKFWINSIYIIWIKYLSFISSMIKLLYFELIEFNIDSCLQLMKSLTQYLLFLHICIVF